MPKQPGNWSLTPPQEYVLHLRSLLKQSHNCHISLPANRFEDELFSIHNRSHFNCCQADSYSQAVRLVTDAELLTWLLLLLIPTPAAAAAADPGVESEADRPPPVLPRVVAQHSSVLSFSHSTHTHTHITSHFNIQ